MLNTMDTNSVFYFGFGANSHPKMMQAVIGRIPEGRPAELRGYELGIQKFVDLPQTAQRILKKYWKENFKSYVIRPNPKKSVSGTLWKLSFKERQLVARWELVGLWQSSQNITVITDSTNIVQAETEVVPSDSIISPVEDSESYKPFIVAKRKILRVARQTRDWVPAHRKKIFPLALSTNLALSFIFSFLLYVFLKDYNVLGDVPALFSGATFLFSILIGFSLSRRYTRLVSLKEAIRVNDARLSSMMHMMAAFPETIQQTFRNKLEAHLISQIDYRLEHFHQTLTSLNNLYSFTVENIVISPGDVKQQEHYVLLLNSVSALSESHRHISHLVEDKMPQHESIALWVLAGVVWLGLLSLDGGTLFLLLVPVLSTILIYLLLVLRSLDRLLWGEQTWIWRPLTRLFQELGMVPYFPEAMYTSGRLPQSFFDNLPSYRIAYYPNSYPDFSDKEVATYHNFKDGTVGNN